MSSPSNPSNPKRFRWAPLIGLIVSVALLAWVLHRINLREVWTYAQHANPLLLLLTVVVATVTFPIRTLRWQLILRDPHDQRLPFVPLWHATTIGFMANNLLPARAGEVARAYVASRQLPVRFSTAFVSIVVERVFDGLIMLALMTVAIVAPSFPAHAAVGGRSLSTIATSLALLFAVVLLIALLVANKPRFWLVAIERMSRRFLPVPIADRIVRTSDGIVAGLLPLKNPARFLGVVLWSLVLWLKNALAFWTCFKAFGLPLPFEAAFLLQGIIGFGVAVPSTPGFVGIFEAAALITLGFYGVDSSLAASYALTYHVTTFIPITLLGFWSLSRLHLKLREVGKAAQSEPQA